jgi:adhesin transport system membrane fusion protein
MSNIGLAGSEITKEAHQLLSLAHINRTYRNLAIIISVLLVSGICFAYFYDLTVDIDISGQTTVQNGLVIIRSEIDGEIASSFFKEGDLVNRDDVLIEIQNSRFFTNSKRLNKDIILESFEVSLLKLLVSKKPLIHKKNTILQSDELYDNKLHLVDTYLNRQKNFFVSMEKYSQDIELQALLIKEARIELDQSIAEYNRANNEFERLQPLYMNGHIAESRFTQAKDRLYDSKLMLERQKSAVEREHTQLEILKKIKDQFESNELGNWYNTITQLQNSIDAKITEKLNNDDIIHHTIFKAPVSGKIIKINTELNGNFITIGTPLITILPNEQPIIIEGVVTSDNIGFLRVGQSALIEFLAFPKEKYGQVEGTVLAIEPIGTFGSRNALPAFNVKICPHNDVIELGNTEFRINHGMALNAKIKTGEKNLLSRLTDTFYETDSVDVYQGDYDTSFCYFNKLPKKEPSGASQ